MSNLLYPTDTEIKAYGNALGVFGDMADSDIDTLLANTGKALKNEWENYVGWKPFLFESEESIVRYYDPPGQSHRYQQGNPRWISGGKVLLLETGLLELDEIRHRVTDTYEGNLLVENQNYWKLPYDAASKNLRVTAIKFSWTMQGLPKSITIKGKFGYTDSLPDDVFIGLRNYGLSKMLRTNLTKFIHEPVEWQEGDVRERHGTGHVENIIRIGENDFRALIRRYRYAGI